MPETKFIAVGPHAGKTITLAHFQFVEGVYTFEGSDDDAVRVGHTLETQYSAFREDRAPEALERYEAMIAEAALTEPAVTAQTMEVSQKERLIARRFLVEKLSPAAAYGEGEAADRVMATMRQLCVEDAEAAGEDLETFMRRNFGQPEEVEAEVVVTEPVTTAVVGVGDEVKDEAKAQEPPAVMAPTTVADALKALDPENDMHWTARGVPSVDAVSALLARGVTRSEIEAVAPDLTRTAARTK